MSAIIGRGEPRHRASHSLLLRSIESRVIDSLVPDREFLPWIRLLHRLLHYAKATLDNGYGPKRPNRHHISRKVVRAQVYFDNDHTKASRNRGLHKVILTDNF